MPHSVRRRELLAGAGAAVIVGALQGCANLGAGQAARLPPPRTEPPRPNQLMLPRIRASTDRITRITVCTRPFRARGPRLDVEQVGRKTVVHNYGHGGSGWSLSWGSSGIAVKKALATGERDIAVLGCGALGLTSALLLQRAGARATIYAKELPPNVRSSLATGLWTPDSRICFDEYATPSFKKTWQAMARDSFQTYQTLLGLPGNPVEFIDQYIVSDTADTERRHDAPTDGRKKFAELQHELIGDLIPNGENYAPGSHPFNDRYMRRNTLMMFNLTAYARMLMSDFIANGGKIEVVEFRTRGDLATLRQRTLINATGYGARALFDDQSITPVRGQLTRLIPQPEVGYGLYYKGVSFVPRRDGLVFQAVGEDDNAGFNDATTIPDRAEANFAVNTIATLFDGV
ncbi:MAG: FAD-binding oxidoreductase [Pseudomonadota bacterium]|nr:FAD-binding oxidoreductase [Pseudomonadota bacterium]